MSRQSDAFYTDNSNKFFGQYQSLHPDNIYTQVRGAFDLPPGLALDIGSGSGRDSKWLASMGHKVISIEPAAGLRKLAMDANKGENVTYFDSSLPELKGLDQFVGGFDLILCAAVIMHLDRLERREALQKIKSLLRQDGEARAVITYKIAPAEPERAMNSLDIEDVQQDIEDLGMSYSTKLNEDLLGRSDTLWYSTIISNKISLFNN
jgi:2-polyprenyl-3-methyl-5-hydroxy-6-metoxy-1,4-benzoquinol methylase